MDDRDEALQEDYAYILVRRQRDEAEDRLTASMTEEQKELFSQYMDEENRIVGIEFRHVFLEALGIVHDILNVSL